VVKTFARPAGTKEALPGPKGGVGALSPKTAIQTTEYPEQPSRNQKTLTTDGHGLTRIKKKNICVYRCSSVVKKFARLEQTFVDSSTDAKTSNPKSETRNPKQTGIKK
jgi:hypothetical protein